MPVRTPSPPRPPRHSVSPTPGGTYAEVLKRRNLSGEAVEKSEINPPGLPKP
ncbi:MULTISPECIES: hypothetical protein [Streptomyces]|uniref:Uncharacterized protein n=1 Tax=Streptomyces odorifer TaxID=53450 RepID=A0A7Y6F1F2_9ACTN|nr:hypothetical protein [Streptomyces odorifer]NUV31076.1 hypothetical protein [Streptomyces odorifer]NUV36739.1 hypothetical protein [Streptomyces sp. KAI-27]